MGKLDVKHDGDAGQLGKLVRDELETAGQILQLSHGQATNRPDCHGERRPGSQLLRNSTPYVRWVQ